MKLYLISPFFFLLSICISFQVVLVITVLFFCLFSPCWPFSTKCFVVCHFLIAGFQLVNVSHVNIFLNLFIYIYLCIYLRWNWLLINWTTTPTTNVFHHLPQTLIVFQLFREMWSVILCSLQGRGVDLGSSNVMALLQKAGDTREMYPFKIKSLIGDILDT